ncbi:MAG: nuclear transport factor 2 family protein [Anaerolineae bacterium]
MIDHASVSKWLRDYISAWESYDPAAIGALFSENAGYRYNPYDEPVRGRQAIIENWLENRDDPNTYKAEYTPIAVDGEVAVAQGRTQYFDSDGMFLRQFDNIFVIRFDSEGRCLDFCEWFMQPRGQK